MILPWLIGWLCERTFRSRLTLREEGQVELLGETPNGLSATTTLANGNRECQYYLRGSGCVIKSAANSCTALCSSKNAVGISSARTTKRFPQ